MKLLYDYFPILLFVIVYYAVNIYAATAVAMVASGLQVSIYWLKFRRFEKIQLITFALIIIFGTPTLILHDPMFIKWKVSVLYWIFAIVFLITQWVGKEPMIQRLMGSKVTLPTVIWKRLNLSWAFFTAFVGFVNLYVIYNFSTDAWVNFKLFGTLGLTLTFVVLQAIYMSRHMDMTDPTQLKPKND